MERKQGESRRTSKRQQDVNGGGEAPTTDLTAVMDNYFFFNAAHAVATAGRPIGGKINGDKNIIKVGNNDAHSQNPYPDSEELESRFVRTLEWVGEASRALSPSSSSLSREAAISRSLLRAPTNTTINNDDDDDDLPNTEFTNAVIEIMSNTNNNNNNQPNATLTNEVREIMSNSNEITETNGPGSINANLNETCRRTRNIMHASVSRDIYTGSSCRVPPPTSAISHGEVHATSFRAPKSSSNGANPNVNPSFRPSNGVPNLEDGPAKRRDKGGINSSANHNCNLNHNNNHNGENLHSKPGYAMGRYDRNDRLAKSAYHKTQRKVHPNDENFLGPVEKFTNKKSQKVGAASSAREAAAAGEVAQTSSAAKVQQWFSKLIGKSSKSDQPKSSKSPKPPAPANAKKVQAPTKLSANPAANQLAYETTMHDVLTHKANLIPNPAPNPKLDDIKPPLPRIDLLHHPITDIPTAPISANPAPISNNHEEARGSSRRFLDDAHLQRFGYGSKSEKWAPLHLHQQQQRQAKQRLVAPLPTNYNTNHGKPARSSPAASKAQQQIKLPSKLVDAKMCDNDSFIDESSSPVKRQQQIMDEDERNPPRFTPNFQSKSQLVQPSKANASRLAAEDAQYGRVISANPATKQERGDNPSAFIANYASQSERFSSRRIRNEARRSFNKSARAPPIELKGAIKGEEGLISANDEIKSPPAADEELPKYRRDIEVLNNFLIQKKEGLQHCSDDSRLHLILSDSSLSSMISALCYSWILHNSKTRKMDGWEHVPVMNIPRNNMWNHKQLAWLFQQAGLDTQALLFIDEVDKNDIAGSVGEYRISIIGQDIVRVRGEVASCCTIIAETFFKEMEASMQAKCIRILLLVGVLIDTENVFCTRRDEMAASSLLPKAGHNGREVLLAELKQKHETQEFYNMMCESYGNQRTKELGSFEDMHNYRRHKAMDVSKHDGTRSKHEKYTSSSFSSSDNTDFFSEDASSLARTKSSKSYSSVSTTSTGPEKSRLSPTSSPPIDRTYISQSSTLCGGDRNTNL